MKHPVERDLALFAGHDLNLLADWRVGRHVSRCEQCRAAVDSYEALRAETAALGELPPDLAWGGLASEMKANIRLGLAAGECVAGAGDFSETRAKAGGSFGLQLAGAPTLLAYAGVVVLVAAGLWLQRATPTPSQQAQQSTLEDGRMDLAATRDGIEISEAGGSFGLRYGAPRRRDEIINYSADARGSMGARYVDKLTGHLTVVSMNVE